MNRFDENDYGSNDPNRPDDDVNIVLLIILVILFWPLALLYVLMKKL